MPIVVIAPALTRWLTPSPTQGSPERKVEVPGTTVREVLDALFAEFPTLRGYVTDEHGTLRHHVVAYLNNEPIRDKVGLGEVVPANGELYLFQALSGG